MRHYEASKRGKDDLDEAKLLGLTELAELLESKKAPSHGLGSDDTFHLVSKTSKPLMLGMVSNIRALLCGIFIIRGWGCLIWGEGFQAEDYSTKKGVGHVRNP